MKKERNLRKLYKLLSFARKRERNAKRIVQTLFWVQIQETLEDEIFSLRLEF